MTGGGGAAGSGSGQSSSLMQSSLNTNLGAAGATIGTGAFIGRSDNSGRFVGNARAGTQNRNNMASQFSQLQNLNSNNQNGNSNTTVPPQVIRPQIQLGFQAPTLAAPVLETTLTTRLASLPALESRADGVHMSADETGAVTLTGKVASDDDRRLLEALIRLEPGVRGVRNDLQVAP